jgi:anti-sigma B factor antagonist
MVLGTRRGIRLTNGKVIATDLEIILDENDATTLLRLRGRLSIDSSPAFRDQLLAVLRGQSTRAVVDMTEVSYIDISGIATLIEGLKIAHHRQNTLCLQGLQGRVLHLFEFAGLLDLFETNGVRSASSVSKVS